MKSLIRRPFLSGLLLSLPLWIVLRNYVVALSLGLLVSFLVSMLCSIVILDRQRTNVPSKQDRADPHD